MNHNNIIRIASLNKFLEEISKFANKKIVYRGQSNEAWEVTSSAYRRLHNPDSNALLNYNVELIEKALRYSDEYKEGITDINLLAKLQHYGAATSLIDFTESALIALWFACQDEEMDGKVFCLDMSRPDNFLTVSKSDEKETIDKILKLEFRGSSIPPDNLTISRLDEREKIAEWEPPITDNRILKQDSLFIFNKTGKLGGFAEILIPKKEKKFILKELKQSANLSEETIFPDFYGFAQNNAVDKPYGSQDAEAYIRQGHEKLASGKYEAAIKDYDKAIELNSQFAETHNNRGIANSALGKHEEAIKDYDKAIELNPQDANTYNNRGNANSALDKREEAIKDYDKAIELNPQDANTYSNRGNANSALDKREEAIKDYDKAIELNPQGAAIYYNRGGTYSTLGKYTYSTLGKYEEAIQDFIEAKKLFEKEDNMEMAKKCEKEIERLKKLMTE